MPTRLLWQSVTLTAGPDHSDRSCDVTAAQIPKLNKSKCSQFWMEGSCFQEKSSWKFIFYVVCVWKCVLPEVPQKHSPVLHHSAPKVAGGFGSGEHRRDSHLAHTLSTCSCRQASLSSLPLPLAVFSKEAETLCLPALFILCFTKSHVLLPLTSHLNSTTLKEWSLFSDFLKKEFLSWEWRLLANTEDNGTSLPKKCVSFLYLSRKGFITPWSGRAAQLPNVQPHFPRPAPRCS